MRPARVWLFGAVITTAVAASGWANRERIVLAARGAEVEQRSLDEQKSLIEPYLRFYRPENTTDRLPAVIQFHGCAGYRDDFMAQWAKVGTDNGYIVVGVDSHTPRGIDRDRALSSVCQGKELIGQERAGDIEAAIRLVAERRDVDPSRIIVAGWSHGAWSLMDFFTLTARGMTPPSLAAPDKTVAPVAGAIFFYPYCGPGSWARIGPWPDEMPVLAFVAGADSIVDSAQCIDLFKKLNKNGAELDVVYYPDADHVFDDRGLEIEYRHMYNEKAASDAAARYGAFLRERAAH